MPPGQAKRSDSSSRGAGKEAGNSGNGERAGKAEPPSPAAPKANDKAPAAAPVAEPVPAAPPVDKPKDKAEP